MIPIGFLAAATPRATGPDPAETALSIYNKVAAWWERDEESGTVMIDAHTNALHGTYSGLTVGQDGLAANLGKAVAFPGGTAYAEVPDHSLIRPTGAVSCMVWASRASTGGGSFPKLMWKPAGSVSLGQATYLIYLDSGRITFRVTVSGGSSYNVGQSTAMPNNQPTFIVGARNANMQRLYVNAVQVASASSIPTGALLTSTDPLRFGYNGNTGFDPFAGAQDQAAVFNGELTASEVAYLYNGGAGRSYAQLKADAGIP